MKIYLFIALFGALFLFACDEDEMTPVNQDVAPLPVSDVQVENLPGGAKITYRLPKDKNLLYVKALYTISANTEREVKASYYQNYLVIDGFSDTLNYNVRLYTVSRGEQASGPVVITVKPLIPPVMEVFESLQVAETFGGIRVAFENRTEANVVLTVLATDTIGDLVQADAYYTKRRAGSFAVRGFEPEKRTFGVFVRDRWNNCSDTLFADLTPVFEQKLDKTKFKHVMLSGDTYEPHLGWDINRIWDDITNVTTNIFCTKPGTGLPQWFTVDLGVTTTLSRLKLHHRNAGLTDGSYTGGDPEIYEIWGSNDPDQDGGWTNWTLLTTCQSVKPSGLPLGTVSSEDKQFAEVDGEDFDFPFGIPPVRYIRFKTLKVWGLLDYVYFSELTFWGSADTALTDQ